MRESSAAVKTDGADDLADLGNDDAEDDIATYSNAEMHQIRRIYTLRSIKKITACFHQRAAPKPVLRCSQIKRRYHAQKSTWHFHPSSTPTVVIHQFGWENITWTPLCSGIAFDMCTITANCSFHCRLMHILHCDGQRIIQL